MGIALLLGLGLLLVGGGYVLVRRIRASQARSRQIWEKVEKERAATAALPADEAYSRAEAIIAREDSSVEEWGTSIPSAIEGQLDTLDPRLAELLRRFRRIRLPQYEAEATEISAEFFSALPPTPIPDGHVAIGRDAVGDDMTQPEWALTTVPGDPRVYEIIMGRVRAEYRTIAHFILLTVDED